MTVNELIAILTLIRDTTPYGGNLPVVHDGTPGNWSGCTGEINAARVAREAVYLNDMKTGFTSKDI